MSHSHWPSIEGENSCNGSQWNWTKIGDEWVRKPIQIHCTQGPTFNEFSYYEHSAVTSRSVRIKLLVVSGSQCNYRPQTKFAKVMFLHVSAILSKGEGAGTPRTSYTPPGPATPPGPGTHLPQDQVHPRDQVHPPGSSVCWEIRATSGRYASYWNAFLFLEKLVCVNDPLQTVTEVHWVPLATISFIEICLL